jgi:hypothetical protein
MLDIQIRGASKLRAMADQLRKADKEYLGRQLNKAIRRAAEPTLRDVQESARNIDTSGVRKPGARHRFMVAMPPKGTRAKIADSITFTVSVLSDNPRVQFRTGRGLPAELKNMPRRFDDPEFRHPVMGNREVWVAQKSNPWWFEPIRKNLATFRAEIDVALDATREMLERG